MKANLYFSDYFGADPRVLEDYGAFDISVVSDLPLFIDPFLLFNSEKRDYQELHEGIIRYLRFLRQEATPDSDPGLVKAWYRFKEVRQNWLGFAVFGNGGSALGPILDRCVAEYLERDEDYQVAFKGSVKGILRTYNFLVTVTPFGVPVWESYQSSWTTSSASCLRR